MLVFLAINGVELQYTQKDLYSIILNVASGQKNEQDLWKWILEHQKQNRNVILPTMQIDFCVVGLFLCFLPSPHICNPVKFQTETYQKRLPFQNPTIPQPTTLPSRSRLCQSFSAFLQSSPSSPIHFINYSPQVPFHHKTPQTDTILQNKSLEYKSRKEMKKK